MSNRKGVLCLVRFWLKKGLGWEFSHDYKTIFYLKQNSSIILNGLKCAPTEIRTQFSPNFFEIIAYVNLPFIDALSEQRNNRFHRLLLKIG